MRVISIKLNDELVKAIDSRHQNRSEFIRECIKKCLEGEGNDEDAYKLITRAMSCVSRMKLDIKTKVKLLRMLEHARSIIFVELKRNG